MRRLELVDVGQDPLGQVIGRCFVHVLVHQDDGADADRRHVPIEELVLFRLDQADLAAHEVRHLLDDAERCVQEYRRYALGDLAHPGMVVGDAEMGHVDAPIEHQRDDLARGGAHHLTAPLLDVLEARAHAGQQHGADIAVHVAAPVDGNAQRHLLGDDVGKRLDPVLVGEGLVQQHMGHLEAGRGAVGPEQDPDVLDRRLEGFASHVGRRQLHVGGDAHGHLAAGDQGHVGETAGGGLVGDGGAGIGRGQRRVDAGANRRPQAARARPGKRQIIGLGAGRSAKDRQRADNGKKQCPHFRLPDVYVSSGQFRNQGRDFAMLRR